MTEEPTIGELKRAIDRLERTTVTKYQYEERQKALDKEFSDVENWQEAHEESHQWLSRLVAGTAFTLLVTLVVIVIENIVQRL